MSFTEKLGSIMARPNDDLVSKDEIPWWLKYSARGLGSVAGGFAVLFGVFSTVLDSITFNGFSCVFGGLLLCLVGFTVLIAEAPCCCMFVDYVQQINDRIERRPYWNRAAYYLIASTFVFILCCGLWASFSCIMIFCTGLLYGMMAMGKKGTRADMAAAASSTGGAAPQGEHSRTLMEDPDVWRPA